MSPPQVEDTIIDQRLFPGAHRSDSRSQLGTIVQQESKVSRLWYEMADADGASPKEQIIEACRRDNIELFQEVLGGMSSKPKEEIAKFFNDVVDTMGNHLLHLCANYGSYDVMNELLDIEYLECDPLTRRDKETPLHSAVRYANERELELGEAIVKMLVEAGADPRVKDGHGRKPADICTPKAENAKAILRQEEYILNEGLRKEDGEDEDAAGSASDSDA